jgi:hypothetical protein
MRSRDYCDLTLRSEGIDLGLGEIDGRSVSKGEAAN